MSYFISPSTTVSSDIMLSPVVPLISPLVTSPSKPGEIVISPVGNVYSPIIDAFSPVIPFPLSPVSALAPSPFVSAPVVMTLDGPPYKTSVDFSYSQPLVSVYRDLEADPKVQKRMVKYFFYKVLDKWLFEDLKDLLGYLNVTGEKVSLISDTNKFNATSSEKDSVDVINKKADFIGKYIFTMSVMTKVLRKFVQEANASWYDLPKHEFFIRQVVRDNLEKALKLAIKESK